MLIIQTQVFEAFWCRIWMILFPVSRLGLFVRWVEFEWLWSIWFKSFQGRGHAGSLGTEIRGPGTDCFLRVFRTNWINGSYLGSRQTPCNKRKCTFIARENAKCGEVRSERMFGVRIIKSFHWEARPGEIRQVEVNLFIAGKLCIYDIILRRISRSFLSGFRTSPLIHRLAHRHNLLLQIFLCGFHLL